MRLFSHFNDGFDLIHSYSRGDSQPLWSASLGAFYLPGIVVLGDGYNDNGPHIVKGAGTPENNVTAPTGSIYLRSDGGVSTTFYVKESGTGNTGWIAK